MSDRNETLRQRLSALEDLVRSSGAELPSDLREEISQLHDEVAFLARMMFERPRGTASREDIQRLATISQRDESA